MSKIEAVEVLRVVAAKYGRNYKSRIRDAWESGLYESLGLADWDQQLQIIRNTFGPSWLTKVKV